jgi:hypothetical protein
MHTGHPRRAEQAQTIPVQNFFLAKRYWKQFVKPEMKALGLSSGTMSWWLTPTALAVTDQVAANQVKAKARCEVRGARLACSTRACV